ncbi:glycosyltransferase [Amaricoccus solimangrovi]|uniref:Glycosyltransferase n=1 Tax=Amaricoccus solimangrovi TaxID=2589815 RepID=A0A501WVI6_9RHOB|nr:glycosyltransferase [Amaricoccus solimangrovi]TPE51387.1 glycosyltransferase [Amaricoccus solimangrovi]
MRILFIHDNFPAQFGVLGVWLARQGWDVTFATSAEKAAAPGIRVLRYAPHRAPSPETHPYAQPMDKAAINGQGFARAALRAREAGYAPDIIVAHSGWGGGMFARDVFPKAAYVAYCEWWYRHPGADVAFLSRLTGEPVAGSVESPMLESARNAPIAMDLARADAVICPTRFQAEQFPDRLRALLTVQHDGIDTAYHAPDPADRRSTLDGLVAPDAPVVTYATRGMEPHRGFPQFMASLPAILARDPRLQVVIAGENRVAYGNQAKRAVDWKAKALADHDLDPARVRFVGRLDRPLYRRLLRRSDAHVYLTVPFVLSWSMLEAMSLACPLVLSDTAPVREFADASSARLVPFGDPAAIAEGVLETLAERPPAEARGARAREIITSTCSIATLWPEKARLFTELARAGG